MVEVSVVRVFTDPSGEFGNDLGIVDAAAVAPPDRQALAAKLGFAETVFVEPPVDGAATIRIFTPAVELPFAGHPTVGTGWWLNERHLVTALHVPAGRVDVQRTDGLTRIRARVDWAPEFVIVQHPNPADVDALDPAAFSDGHHYHWSWIDEPAGAVRSRMFAPDFGIAEDEATGAAAVRLTGLLQRDLTITQGRGSQIFTIHDTDGWVRIGGRVVADRTRSA